MTKMKGMNLFQVHCKKKIFPGGFEVFTTFPSWTMRKNMDLKVCSCFVERYYMNSRIACFWPGMRQRLVQIANFQKQDSVSGAVQESIASQPAIATGDLVSYKKQEKMSFLHGQSFKRCRQLAQLWLEGAEMLQLRMRCAVTDDTAGGLFHAPFIFLIHRLAVSRPNSIQRQQQRISIIKHSNSNNSGKYQLRQGLNLLFCVYCCQFYWRVGFPVEERKGLCWPQERY